MTDTAWRQTGDNELILGYAPALREESGWPPVFRQEWPADDGGIVRRVIREYAADRHQRLLIDVEECVSARVAAANLEKFKSDSNVKLVTASTKLGPQAVANATKAPRSLFFTRANLAIWVFSGGREPVDVEPWAVKIVSDLDAVKTEDGDEQLALKHDSDPRESRGTLQIRFELPWDRGPWAWFKFKADGGRLERAAGQDTLVLLENNPGAPARITGWAIEPGRKTCWGKFGV